MPTFSTQQQIMMNLITTQQQTRNCNKIVIFDWDDTIFPTTAVFKQKSNENKTVKVTDLKKLSEKVLNLLNEYCSIYGEENVFIITNGGENWIFQSLKYIISYCIENKIENSFNSIYRLLANSKITSISANYLYSKQYPKKTMLWKYLAFQQIVYYKFLNNNNNNNNKYTLISIGDSNDEYFASQNIVNELQNRYNINVTLHRLKLTKKPTINRMIEQFELITSLGPSFKETSHDIDIDYAANHIITFIILLLFWYYRS